MKLKIRAPHLLAFAMTLAAQAFAGPADEALKALRDGNARFVAGQSKHPNSTMQRVAETGANGQKPLVTILGCSDSRVPPERIFDAGVGEVFVVRVAGNVADGDEIGSAEYGTHHLNTPLMVVLGHSKCGAITAVATGAQVHGSIPGLVDNIIPAVESAKKKFPDLAVNDLIAHAINENVYKSIADTLTGSNEIRTLVKERKLQIIGAVYDIDTGKVNWLGQHPEEAALLNTSVTPSEHHANQSVAAHEAPHTTTGQSPHDTTAEKGVSGKAAPRSKITSTGSFTSPALNIAQRASFGAKAGKPQEYESIKEPAKDNGLFFYAFGSSAILSLLITVGAAFSLSRTTRVDGSSSRALTLGTKLSAGFGIVVTGILVLASISNRGSTVVANAMAQAQHLNTQDILIKDLDANMWATRMYVKNFLISNSEEDLAKFSNSAASFTHKHDLAHQTIKYPERVKMVEAIGTQMEDYLHKFSQVVRLIDERNAVVDGQMGPAADRATQLIREIAASAHEDGDDSVGFYAADTNETLQEARLAFFKFLRGGEKIHATQAVEHAEETQHKLTTLESKIQNPARKEWLKEAGQAISFWVERMEHAEKLQETRNELVHNQLDKLGPAISHDCDQLIVSLDKTKAQVTEEANSVAASVRLQIALVSGAIAFIGAFLAVSIAGSVVRALSAMISRITEIRTSNDMTKRVDVKSRDETGLLAESFNGMIQTLHDIIAEVKSGSVQIDSGGKQIASASQTMALLTRERR